MDIIFTLLFNLFELRGKKRGADLNKNKKKRTEHNFKIPKEKKEKKDIKTIPRGTKKKKKRKRFFFYECQTSVHPYP